MGAKKFIVDGRLSISAMAQARLDPAAINWVGIVIVGLEGNKIWSGKMKVNKTQACELMLQMVRDLWPTFYPSSVSTDFEQAMINALCNIFPPPQIDWDWWTVEYNIDRANYETLSKELHLYVFILLLKYLVHIINLWVRYQKRK